MNWRRWKGLVGTFQGILKGVSKEKESVLIIFQDLPEARAFRTSEGNH